MEYKAIYKCRLCGAVYHNGQTAHESVAAGSLEEMTLDMCGQYPDAPLKTNMHRCGGDYAGSLGLADFLGWSNADEPMAYYKSQAAKRALENIVRRACT